MEYCNRYDVHGQSCLFVSGIDETYSDDYIQGLKLTFLATSLCGRWILKSTCHRGFLPAKNVFCLK